MYHNESQFSLNLINVGVEGILIYVKTQSGKRVTLDVETSDTIKYVKEKLQDKEGYLPEEQQLSFYGKELKDAHTLHTYTIVESGSTLDLVVKVIGKVATC